MRHARLGTHVSISALVLALGAASIGACASRADHDAQAASSELDETRAAWSLTSPPRYAHAQALPIELDDGRVFVASGTGASEIYDPASDRWSSVAAEDGSSRGASGAAVKLQNGSIVVLRDQSEDAWRYDPMNDIWTHAGRPLSVHREPTMTWIPSIGRYLVVGSRSTNERDSELFDPSSAAASAFTRPATMLNTRFGHAATLLRDGRVLVTGGLSGSQITQTCEVYDPSTNTWSAARSMHHARWHHSATLLADGRVFVAGNERIVSSGTARGLWGGGGTTAEIYDPAANVWTDASEMATSSIEHTATLLDDGRVLLVGGSPDRRVRIYDPKSDTWGFGPELTERRWNSGLLGLRDGTYLAVGGKYMMFMNGNPGDVGMQATRRSAERLHTNVGRDDGIACSVSTECKSGFCVDGVCCESACGGGADDCQACSVRAGGDEDGRCTVAHAGTECRGKRGACDIAETCDGTSGACPADAVVSQGASCRSSAGVCDIEEVCTGVFAYCPDDGFKPNGAVCQAGQAGAGFCYGGACKPESEWPTN